MMKSSVTALCLIFTMAGYALAGTAGTETGLKTSERVMVSAKELVRMGIDQEDVDRLDREMASCGFTIEEMLRAHQVVRETVREGLPAAPVLNKAFEGMAKGAGAALTLAAMEKVRARYSYAYQKARDLDQTDISGRLGDVMAQCMTAGLDDALLERITLMLKSRIRTMNRDEAYTLCIKSFMTVREMVRMGASPRNATDAVCLGLERSWGVNDMERLRLSFMVRARTESPDDVARDITGRIREGRTISGGVGAGHTGSTGTGAGLGGGSSAGQGHGGGGGASGGQGSHGGSSGSGSGGPGGAGRGGGKGR